MKTECYIGIDSGATTGFAAWDARLGEFEEFYSGTFWEVYRRVLDYPTQTTIIILEDPNKNKPVFTRGVNKRSILKIGQNVGMNKRDAQLLQEGFEFSGFTVVPIKPKGKGKGTTRKWTPQTFMNMTGHHSGLNEHIRDAAMMVFGRPLRDMSQFQQQRAAS